MDANRIEAIVLAAGESRRMGTQKLLLPFGGTTVVGAVVSAALASECGRVIVVLGADRDGVRRAVEALGAREGRPAAEKGRAPGRLAFAVNEDFRSGMLSSIQTGFRALDAEAEAALVLLGDQPHLKPAVVNEVVAAGRASGKGIVIPVHRGRRGHPVLIDARYRGEVLALAPAEGLRGLMRAHPGDIREVEVPDAGILRDLDTPADYQDGVRPTFYPPQGPEEGKR